jgi:hypothetical protein
MLAELPSGLQVARLLNEEALMFTKAKLLAIALGGFLLLGVAGAANAADWDRGCDRKIAHEQRELDRAIERHGYWSHQAQNDRRELDRLYARCRNRDGYR